MLYSEPLWCKRDPDPVELWAVIRTWLVHSGDTELDGFRLRKGQMFSPRLQSGLFEPVKLRIIFVQKKPKNATRKSRQNTKWSRNILKRFSSNAEKMKLLKNLVKTLKINKLLFWGQKLKLRENLVKTQNAKNKQTWFYGKYLKN